MANSWFRLYSEIRRDPKVKTMPEAFQLRLIWLYTLRCEGPTERLSADELMYGLDCDETLLETLHSAFHAKGFIDEDWSIPNWNRRQYVSDSSTERVRKYRSNRVVKRYETLQKRCETQDVTDQNRTDEEQKKKIAAPFVLPDWVPKEQWEAWMPVRKKKRAADTPFALNIAVKRLAELNLEGWNPVDVLEQSILKGYTGLFPVQGKIAHAEPKPKLQFIREDGSQVVAQ